jgi:hypothetical protein
MPQANAHLGVSAPAFLGVELKQRMLIPLQLLANFFNRAHNRIVRV